MQALPVECGGGVATSEESDDVTVLAMSPFSLVLEFAYTCVLATEGGPWSVMVPGVKHRDRWEP